MFFLINKIFQRQVSGGHFKGFASLNFHLYFNAFFGTKIALTIFVQKDPEVRHFGT